MRYSNKSFTTQRSFAQQLISVTNATPEIQERMAARGFPAEHIAVGQQLHDAAAQAGSSQALAAGAALLATRRAREAGQAARDVYEEVAAIGRELFPDGTPERATLKVNGSAPKGAVAFLAAAQTLFDNALQVDRIGSALAQYGLGRAVLEDGRALVTAYGEALHAQAAAKRAAVRATAARREAHERLREWTRHFVAVARAALRKRPDLQRELSIAHKSPRKRATGSPPAEPAAPQEIPSA